MSRSYRESDLKILWSRSAGRCAYPGCMADLIEAGTVDDPEVAIGQIAHIVGHSDSGPRADPALSPEERNRYANLILLCPNDHARVDRQENTYTVEDLRAWKAALERRVREFLTDEITLVGFVELESITSAIAGDTMQTPSNFTVITPHEKIRRNGLSETTTTLIATGLSIAPKVRAYIGTVAQLDAYFPDRLKARFVEEYGRLRESGLGGDALFDGMRIFANGRRREFRVQAAGLAVLAYLFEACEVSER